MQHLHWKPHSACSRLALQRFNEESMKREYIPAGGRQNGSDLQEADHLLDGAHNEDAAKRLVQSLEAYYPGQKWQFIMGVFADKEYQK